MLTSAQTDSVSLGLTCQQLVEVIHFFHTQGWCPATSSNFSYRTDAGFDITVSGRDKGQITVDDFISLAPDATLLPDAQGKPSAETLLHAFIYEQLPDANCVVHTHSVFGTVVSKLHEIAGEIILTDFEILKGFAGITTHKATVTLPVFKNNQDMTVLQSELRAYYEHRPLGQGFLLAGHGLYTWGSSPVEAKRHVEVFEFLFQSVLQLQAHGYFKHS